MELPISFWKIAKWATNRQIKPVTQITPPLANTDGSLEVTPVGKVNLLRTAFSPPPIPANLSDIQGTDYPAPYPVPPITDSEVERAIKKAKPNKVPETDGITNSILQKVLGPPAPYSTPAVQRELDNRLLSTALSTVDYSRTKEAGKR